jgi:serine/threonine-protein kinase
VAEGKLVVQLEHASIAQVYDLGEEDGVPYLAMEYVDGRDLRDAMRLARVADLLPRAEIRIAMLVGILEALEYAHSVTDARGRSLGIIHRDVSPANVMISRSGEVKLVDFGIARATERGDLSLPGALQGKFAYMSPEQASGGVLDGRSDLFSVGVLAWELFCGARPFDGETNLATLDRTRHHDPGSLADSCTDAPPEVVDVVDRLLSKSPEDRPSSATEAIRTLKGLFLRRGVLVGSREVSEWISELLATVPEALRDPGSSTFSLEEALRLPMGDGPGHSPVKTATVSMVGSASHDLELLELSTVAPTKPGRDPTTAELGVSPPTIGPARRRGRLVGLLVSLNLLLLISVAVLVWQQSGGPQVETSQQMGVPKTHTQARAPRRRSSPEPRASEVAELPPAPETAAEQPAVEPSLESAQVKPASRTERATASTSRSALSTQGGKGRVVFRFYPASSKVVLDGRTLDTGGSNVVNREISQGRHRLILIGPDGGQRTDTFQIKAGKTTNLTTLHVTAR